MSNINKTVVRNTPLTSVVLEAAIKSGVVLSVLIAPNSVKLFCTMAIVQYPTLNEVAQKACANNLRRAGVPFAAANKALNPTLSSIPAEHLAGRKVEPKVFPQAQPATRPVVKTASRVPFTVSTASEVPHTVEIPGVTPVEAKPAKKSRKAKKATEVVG